MLGFSGGEILKILTEIDNVQIVVCKVVHLGRFVIRFSTEPYRIYVFIRIWICYCTAPFQTIDVFAMLILLNLMCGKSGFFDDFQNTTRQLKFSIILLPIVLKCAAFNQRQNYRKSLLSTPFDENSTLFLITLFSIDKM